MTIDELLAELKRQITQLEADRDAALKAFTTAREERDAALAKIAAAKAALA
jgi:hypothetical protein